MGFRLFITIVALAAGLAGFAVHWQSEPQPTIWFPNHQTVTLEAMELSEKLAESYVVSKAAWNRSYVAYLHQQRERAERKWEPSEHLTKVALQQNPGLGRAQAYQIAQAIVDSAERHDVDPFLVAALISQESKFRPHIVSPGGAVGLGQILPGTARGLGVDPHSPSQNVEGCVKYLRAHLNHWNGRVDLALASYNAGPGAVQRFGGVPPYRITQNYVTKINVRTQEFRKTAKKARERWMVANGPRMVDIYGRKVHPTVKSAEPS